MASDDTLFASSEPSDYDLARLEALYETGLLDSPPEVEFDRLTDLTRRLLHVPVALVSLVDADRQFFKSSPGLPEPWLTRRETPLSHSFCQHVVHSNEPLIVEDARSHPLVCDNLAIRDLNVIGYLGIPLVTPDGYAIGSLCAIDTKPRSWSDDEVRALTDLAALVIREIELQYYLRRLRDAEHALQLRSDELEARNNELSQFTRIAAHDLGSPLQAILIFGNLLQNKYGAQFEADDVSWLHKLVRSSERMQTLLQDLLSYASSGHQHFDMAPVDLSAVWRHTIENLEATLTGIGAQIIHDPLPVVWGQAVYLGLVFQNLLDNAIKYRSADPLRIHLGTQPEDDGWRISISDNGIGIHAAHLETIFEPFQRIDTDIEHSGSGIGLATCKRIIERHGGMIGVRSDPGQGSTFYFTIPGVRN